MGSFADRFIFICLALSAILMIGFFRGNISINDYFLLKQKKEQLSQRVNSLEQEIKQIDREIEKIKHSPAYVKKVLRDRYSIFDEREEVIFSHE